MPEKHQTGVPVASALLGNIFKGAGASKRPVRSTLCTRNSSSLADIFFLPASDISRDIGMPNGSVFHEGLSAAALPPEVLMHT